MNSYKTLIREELVFILLLLGHSTVSHRLLTGVDEFRVHTSTCVICGVQSGSGAYCAPST